MPIGDVPEDAPLDAHLTLAAGLKSCRAVVDNYRLLLSENADIGTANPAETQLFRLETSEPPASPPEEL